MNRALIAFLALISISAVAAVPDDNALRAPQVRTIVIDPGHGGSDQGSIGAGGLMEKDVTLAVALKLRDLISSDPDLRRDNVRVVLTRDDDIKLSLEDRAAKANSEDGDLYISIHINSHQVRSAYGAETYILSLKASDEHARNVAQVENEAMGLGNSENDSAESDDLKLILFDVIQKKYIEESKFVADVIQAEFHGNLQSRDRGVKQAPFRVLKGVAMPAVLVEVDYISNPGKEQLLRTDAYRTRIAESLLHAIKEYKRIKESGRPSIAPAGSGR
ncbi:MAG TPA: N-acetylmuramoyl-L-alanine amidase [Acidobacteriota bacterium]|nr:N-acetylmuramoyl-L-alanine amidase [Acidobacteriota bacterium]